MRTENLSNLRALDDLFPLVDVDHRPFVDDDRGDGVVHVNDRAVLWTSDELNWAKFHVNKKARRRRFQRPRVRQRDTRDTAAAWPCGYESCGNKAIRSARVEAYAAISLA